MAYIPNPADITQPTGSIDASTAAAEFRALKTYIAGLQGIQATWSPTDKSTSVDLNVSNLGTIPNAALSATSFASVRGTIPKNSGKWYFEVTFTAAVGVTLGVGSALSNLETAAGSEIYSYAVVSGTGNIINNGVVLGVLGSPITAGEVVGFGYDLDVGSLTINSNSGQTTVFSASLIGASVYPIISVTYLTTEAIANFGATEFFYTLPAGYLGLTTPNFIYNENPNLLINGNCVIDQHNAGATVNPVVNNTSVIDCWNYFGDVAAKFKAGQNLNSATPPYGYSNYLGVECILAYVPVGTEAFWLEQRIEGYSTVPLAYATPAAAPVTLLFYAWSNQLGVQSGVITDGVNSRAFPFEFTISVINTWTPVAILIPGDTAGSWSSVSNGINMKVKFCLGAVPVRQPVAALGWQDDFDDAVGASGGQDLVRTLGATFYITGLELRRGLYTIYQPRELVRAVDIWSQCLRYFYRSEAIVFVAGVAAGAGNTAVNHVSFPSRMRTSPVVSTTFAAAVNCTGATANISPAGFDLVTTAIGAGVTTISYSSGNTFDARL